MSNMNYEKFKNTILEKGFADEKGIASLVRRLALMVFLFGVGIAVASALIVNTLISIAVIIISAVLFFFCLDFAKQDKECFDALCKNVKFWWSGIVFDVAIVVLLWLFNFL